MYTIERFFCTNLPNGTIAFGWFSIVYSIVSTFVCMIQSTKPALVLYTALGVGAGYLLILAVKYRSDILLLPWLAVHAFHIVVGTPIVLIMLLLDPISELGLFFGALIYLILPTFLIGYGWVGIYSLYLLYKNEAEYGASLTLRSQV